MRFAIPVIVSIVAYVLDERFQWTDVVSAFLRQHRWADRFLWTIIALVPFVGFYCIGCLNGPYTLFSNDCPFGMNFQATREFLNLPWPQGVPPTL